MKELENIAVGNLVNIICQHSGKSKLALEVHFIFAEPDVQAAMKARDKSLPEQTTSTDESVLTTVTIVQSLSELRTIGKNLIKLTENALTRAEELSKEKSSVGK